MTKLCSFWMEIVCQSTFLWFFSSSLWLHKDTEAGTSLPLKVAAISSAWAQGTLTSSFQLSSGISWVLLTLSDLMKVTSGVFHLSSSTLNPFATCTYGGLQFPDSIVAEEKSYICIAVCQWVLAACVLMI